MQGINGDNGIKRLNSVDSVEDKKTDTKKPEVITQSTGNLSSELDYLGAINRVKINTSPIPPSQILQNEEFRLPTDEEFEELKKEIEEKINENPKLKEYIDPNKLTKYNILVADRIIEIASDEKFLDDPDFMKNAKDIIHHTTTKERAMVSDKILSDERLNDNLNFMKYAGSIIYCTGTKKIAQIKCKIIDKILSDEKLYDNLNFMKYAGSIILCTNTEERAQVANKILSDERLYENENVMKNARNIIDHTKTKEEAQVANKILSDERLYENKNVMGYAENIIRYTSDKNLKYLASSDIGKLQEGVDLQRKKVLENPEIYVNGEYKSKEGMVDAVNKFFDQNAGSLLVLSAIFDKETFNQLLRMRFEDVGDYMLAIKDFEPSDIELLAKMNETLNIDSKPFLPTQKIQFIDLLKAYKDNNVSVKQIKKAIIEEPATKESEKTYLKMDLSRLHIKLLYKIMANAGLEKDEIASIPKEKLTAWDIKYIHLLSKEIQEGNDEAFSDILKAGNLEPDFKEYLHSENIYGETNKKTKEIFEESGFNYDKWLNPSKENEIQFVSKDENQERLSQIASQIQGDMNDLMQANDHAKLFIKKQFPKFVKGEEFVIPNEYLTSKSKLKRLVEILSDTSEQGQLRKIWNNAEKNKNSTDSKKAGNARNTLTILDHLNQHIDAIAKINDDKITKTLDWKIKMWDRNPQKDIFQGNYSTCCIGMGEQNGDAMPHYLLNTAYNMIELVDNDTGKTVGNALCYFVADKEGNPAFIIDNIEINNGTIPSYEVGIQLRTQIAEYAANVAKEVTGKDYTPIYMSEQYNDVEWRDLPAKTKEVSFLGDIDCDRIYMDLYGGWIDEDELTSKNTLLQLK